MKDSMRTGLTVTQRIEVDRDRTIAFMGDELRIYSTPAMVHDVEHTCRDFVFEHCAEGEDSVGARVEIDHLAPTMLGMWVEVQATVAEVEGRRVVLEFEVRDAVETVGRGRHVRFVIDKERQAKRLRTKAEKAKGAA